MNRPERLGTLNDSPKHFIEAKTLGEIEAYISGRGKTRIHAGARNLSLNVSDDYGNRFLVELIQNAHDAHERGRHDGEISVVLDANEGEHGCLYVANRGNGFSKENFDAITNIALSSKSVNESIGNKGLGFRSVLQICHWPEIYSANGNNDQGDFDGYCFRFAGVEDIEKTVTAILGSGSQTEIAKEILEKMPCWYLPVYAEERPGLVSKFAQDGFATVVRMPLESTEACNTVVSQIDELLALETPLHLFLDRVSRIGIEREPGNVESLERKVLQNWNFNNEIDIQKLVIGNDEYLVSSYIIKQDVFHKQLEASLQRKEIPEAWRDWKGNARVNVAIRLGTSVDQGRLYCFLPLGEAGAAPFSGYINANFYTKMDRRSVNNGIGLNKFFISTAALVSCLTVQFLIKQNWTNSAGAVADLLCWKDDYAEVIKKFFARFAGGIGEYSLLPTRCNGAAIHWAKPNETHVWEKLPTDCLSIEAVSRNAGAKILIETLTLKQRRSLEDFFAKFSIRFKPLPSVVAHWVECVALKMQSENAFPERWADLYDEVAANLQYDASVLFGKRFLLSANGDLIASEPTESVTKKLRAADIYFPPVMTLEADFDDAETKSLLPLEKLPASLKRGFALLSREVPLLNTDGGNRNFRAFFVSAKLVREYDTGGVIRTLAGVTQSDVLDQTRLQALEWAFRLWSSGRSIAEKETRAANLWVPTRSGWCSAESAMFGNGWAGMPKGKQLEGMLKGASEYSDEITSIRANLLHGFSDWPVQHGTQDDWIRFLQAAGVRDCLRPIGGDESIQLDGRPHNLAYDLPRSIQGLTDPIVKLWHGLLNESAKKAIYSTVQYRSELSPWRLPGQIDIDGYPTDIRRDYAVQVLRALRELKAEHLRFRVYRPGNPSSGSATAYWPTLLFSLLKASRWLPVKKGTGALKFVVPREAWHFNQEDEGAPPRFIELVEPLVAKNIDDESLERLRRDFDLRVLNDQRDASDALSVFVATADNGLTDAREVRRFRELFGSTWTQVVGADQDIDLSGMPVMVDGSVRAVFFKGHDGNGLDKAVYLFDEDNAAKRQLLEELGQPFFDFGTADSEVTWKRLNTLAPGRFRRISDEQLEVYVDGERFDNVTSAPLLTEVLGSWIADFIVCAAEHKGGQFFLRSQNNLAKIKRAALALRLQTSRKLQISMGEGLRDLPESLRGAVVLRKDSHVVLFAQSTEEAPSLSLLSRISEQLAVALQQRDLANGLDASFLRLANLMRGGAGGAPDDEDMAEALGTAVQNLEQTRRYARANLTTHIRYAIVLAACLQLNAAEETLTILASEEDPSEDQVLESMQIIANALGASVPAFIEQLGVVSDLRSLMEVFDLSIGTLNDSIKRLAGEFKPISNEDKHKRQLAAYLSQRGSQIVENLRQGFFQDYCHRKSLSEYCRIREGINTIQPDPEWFESLDDLSDELILAHVESWKTSQGVNFPSAIIDLPSLRECREKNSSQLREFWGRYGKTLSSWVRKEGMAVAQSVRDAWINPAATRQEHAALAHQAGWLDFQILDDLEIASWLVAQGAWPKGMPVSTAYLDWGLSEEDIQADEEKNAREREQEKKRKLQLPFSGQEYSAQSNDYHHLVAAVNAGFQGAEALKNIKAGITSLADIVDPTRSGGPSSGGGGGKSKRTAESALSDEQKKAVGLIGELWAREWIKNYHQMHNGIELNDEIWVSGYSGAVLGSNSGNDMLGYDFIVRLKSKTYYYEVKASIGDSHTFELGPTEIGAAQRYKADNDNQFRILYVANATDPKRTAVSMLPNPFSREGMRKLRAIGRGSVTYEFGVN